MTGYNPRYLSDDREIPITRAVYEKRVLDLDAWDPSTQVIPSPQDPIIGDIDGAIEDGITHTFSESLKIFYKKAGIFSEISDFYNHTTYLFVRFEPSQLADLKVCSGKSSQISILLVQFQHQSLNEQFIRCRYASSRRLCIIRGCLRRLRRRKPWITENTTLLNSSQPSPPPLLHGPRLSLSRTER